LGAFNLTMQISDQFGAQRTIQASWFVFQHIAATATTFTCGFSASSCVLQIPYSGGTPNGAPTARVVSIGDAIFSGRDQGPPKMSSGANCGTSVVPTTWPPGTVASPGKSGSVTINIPSPNTAGYCQFTARATLELVDQSPCGPGYNCASNLVTIDIGI
jgi:hypothetical protein